MAKYSVIFLLIFVIALLGGLFLITKKLRVDYEMDYEVAKIEINGKIFEVEISDTPSKRVKGLSGRKCLKSNGKICPESAEGMLFVFENPGQYNFWMAGMNFPLDIIWVNNNKIVDISKNVQPPKQGEPPIIISPPVKIDKVLELPAGATEKFNIGVGDEIKILP